MTLVAPGEVNGRLTLWARDIASGTLYSYTFSIGSDGLPTLNPAGSAAPVTATSGTAIQNVSLPANTYPAVASPGPLDNSAYPGLYAETTTGNGPSKTSCANGCLYYYPGQQYTGTSGSPLTGNRQFVGILNTKVTQLS